MTKKAIIIGGGVLGSMIAWRLAEQGLSVTVIDASPQVEQASEGSLAWLNVASCPDPDYAKLRIRSLKMWHEIGQKEPTCPIAFQGSVLWSDDPEWSATQFAQMDNLGWPVSMLTPAQLDTLMPGATGLPSSALYAPSEGAAHPGKIVAWARSNAKALGVTFLTGHVKDLLDTSGTITGVKTADGETFSADAVIITAGRGATELMALAGLSLPQRPGAGLVGWSAPTKRVVPHAFSTDSVDFWQDNEGRVLFTSPAAKTPEKADGMDVQDMIAAIIRLFPSLDGITADKTFVRSRPLPNDGLPAFGRTDRAGLFVACTHSGMTLAPVISEAIVNDVIEAAPSELVSAYTSNRFQNKAQ